MSLKSILGIPDAPPAPAVVPPAPLPDLNNPATMAAKSAAQNAALSSAGRQSTILTTAQNRPSGGDYSSKSLG